MRNVTRMSLGLAAFILILGATGCDKLKSRDQLNQGVATFKAGKYAEAVEHFKVAIDLDNSNPNARLYLATAYMSQWIPGADSPENVRMATQAKDEFNKVLAQDPNNTSAIASLASLAFNEATSLTPDKKQAMFDEAAMWYHKLIQIDPKNKEAYYTLGVIAWQRWYPALQLARANLKMKPEDPGPLKDKKVKEELRAQYTSVIDEGMQDLQKALDIDPEYDDAMAYMNLLVRERADLVDSPEDYKKQVEVADSWVQKALDTKKAKAARQPVNNGIVADK